MPDAEEQRNLSAKAAMNVLVEELVFEAEEDMWTEMVTPIVDAKLGFHPDDHTTERREIRWVEEMVATKVKVLRAVADKVENDYAVVKRARAEWEMALRAEKRNAEMAETAGRCIGDECRRR